jgi:ABC-type maltose transport system permease subunit
LSEKTKKILKAIYLVLMVGYAIYSVYCAIAAFVRFKNITGQFLGLLDNWQFDMIKDIQALPVSSTNVSSTSCPTNYNPLLMYNWPGTKEGCNCQNITTLKPTNENITLEKTIYPTKCNSSMISVSCTVILATDAVTMTNYNGYKYCAQRVAGTSFVQTAKNMNEDGTCKTGFTKCGGNSDAINAVCIDATQFGGACPVMDIAGSMINSSYSQLNNSALYITTKGDISSNAMSQIYINEGGVCSSDIGATTTQGSGHILMKSNITYCTSFEGTFSSFGSSIDRVSFFSANNVFISLVVDLNTSVKSTQMITPYKRTYFGFKPVCRPDVSRMSDSEGEVKGIRGAQTGLLAIAILVGFILGVVYIFLELCVMFECGTQERRDKMKCCLDARQWINPIVKLIHIIILVVSVVVSSKVKNYFAELAVKDCGSASTNANLVDLSEQINVYVYQQNRNSLIVTCIMVFIDIVTLLFKLLCAKKEDTGNKFQQVGPASPAPPTPQGP